MKYGRSPTAGRGVAEELDGDRPAELAEVELDTLDEAAQIHDHQDELVLVTAQEGEHLAVRRPQQLERAASERVVALAQADEALHPHRASWGSRPGLDVDRWSGTRIDDHGQEEALGLAREKPALRSLSHCIGVRTALRSPR